MRRLVLRKVFDNVEWEKTGDVGDNSKFYRLALVGPSYYDHRDNIELADVLFLHNLRLSKGHFVASMRNINE